MSPRPLDVMTGSVAIRQSRRAAVRHLIAGLSVALGAAGLTPFRSQAQDATPATADAPLEFLFIQSFASGTLTAHDGEHGSYELTLLGGTGQTVYFADRPERQVGVLPTERVLEAIGFAEDPPNAGLAAQTADGEQVIIVVLTNPQLDAAAGTLTYEVQHVTDYGGAALQQLATEQSPDPLPEQFGPASLFIDGSVCLSCIG